MYNGEKSRVTLQFTNDLINAVYDRFGKTGDIIYQPKGTKHFTVTVEVEISPQFYGWICSFGNKARITGPKSVKNVFGIISERSRAFIDFEVHFSIMALSNLYKKMLKGVRNLFVSCSNLIKEL